MYVLMAPCVFDPSLLPEWLPDRPNPEIFELCIERCEHFGIEIVPLPHTQSIRMSGLTTDEDPVESLDDESVSSLLDEWEQRVREIVREKGEPLCVVGVDHSPTCGVNITRSGDEALRGRGVFLSRFPEIRAVNARDFAKYRIYLAGPLFTEAEQMYNLLLHQLLSAHFFDVYLPQEVGDTSHARGQDEHENIFRRHIEALERSDTIVAVIDGPDADSGTAWEMGYAAALGKRVVALRTDFRRAGYHELVNLMLEQSSLVATRREDLPLLLRSPFT
jgi:nucleoside 2-deoxyribosyltransferase/predicted secreted protein